MKRYLSLTLLVSLLFFILSGSAMASEVLLESKIIRVMIYPDSGLLTRAGSAQVEPGTYQFVFSDIIPMMDENSIRVAGSGSAKAKIFGAQLKKEYLSEKPAQRVQQLEKELLGLSDERRRFVDAHNVVMWEREWLSSLKFFSQEQLPKDLISKVPATKDLGDLLKFMDVSLKDSFIASMDLEIKIRELDKKIDALKEN